MKYERIDLTGQRFGKLVVIKPDHNDNKRGWWWLCRCDCGKEKVIPSGNLRSGSTLSCGCYHRGDEKKDLVGQKFGMLTVISRAEDRFTPSGRKIIRFNCKCDCGNEKTVDSWHLKSGATKSCGCYKLKRQTEANTIHGMTNSRLHYIWSGMLSRCKDLENPLYGGKGISVCEEWHTFTNFMEWAFANGYRDDLTIERLDNDKGYSPENCAWATFKRQANHTSRNHYITIEGVTLTLAEWSELHDIKPATVRHRLKNGYTPVEALLIPVGLGKLGKKILAEMRASGI